MNLVELRWTIVGLGLLIPYLARLPKGGEWLMQYLNTGLAGFLMISGLNTVVWGLMLGCSFFYKTPLALLPMMVLCFGFLAYAHFSLDLASDAQASLALLVIPFMALVPLLVGVIAGFVVDRVLR